MFPSIGVVVIGRNEAEHLRLCLQSVLAQCPRVVYADSGSTDGSVAIARNLGVEVLELSGSSPYTAARGRNEGLARLLQLHPEVGYVQFVDGDCELAPGWLAAGASFLAANPQHAIVCGRLREKHRDASIYNRLCDLEWDRPTGDVTSCGGLFMVRVGAFHEVGGFNAAIGAGEEPELCHRLLAAGWRIHRVDAEMATHDAAMTRFSQWCRRAERSGYGYALAIALHGRTGQRHAVREVRSLITWAIALPLVAATVATVAWGLGLVLLIVYPVQVWRIARRVRDRDWSCGDRWLYGVFCMLAKWPQMLGWLRFQFTGGGSRSESGPKGAPVTEPVRPVRPCSTGDVAP